MKILPKVIIMGRSNVGKSSLFNRLLEKRKALISKTAGTTRDFNIGQVYWQGINFELIDTGGIETITPGKKLKKLSPDLNLDFALDIIKKTQAALKKADLILFVVDIQDGLMPQDKELLLDLKKLNKKIVFAANKTDSLKLEKNAAEFYKLGLGQPTFVSALNGLGTGDLLDEIVSQLKKIKKSRKAEKFEIKNPIRITIMGKPNVGKSSLLNAIMGEDRVIVSPKPFTTREAIDTYFEYNKQNYILVDTAGIRKQAKINKGLEKTSVRSSLANAKNSDICLLVLDISQPITVQDNKLSKVLIDAKNSLIIIANKWDLIKDEDINAQKKFQQYIYKMFPYLDWAPILFTAALSGKNVHRVLALAEEISKLRKIEISENALNRFLKVAIKKHRPQKASGQRQPRVLNLKQIKTNPPVFELRIGKNDTVSQSYLKYLKNALRKKFQLQGTPISIKLKS